MPSKVQLDFLETLGITQKEGKQLSHSPIDKNNCEMYNDYIYLKNMTGDKLRIQIYDDKRGLTTSTPVRSGYMDNYTYLGECTLHINSENDHLNRIDNNSITSRPVRAKVYLICKENNKFVIKERTQEEFEKEKNLSYISYILSFIGY